VSEDFPDPPLGLDSDSTLFGQTKPPESEALTWVAITLADSAQIGLAKGQTRLGPYELLEELGRGGMGVVYRAHDRELGRDVALKLLTQVTEHGRERFRREAELLAQLRHPNVVRLHSAGLAGPTPYLILELVAGESLSARLTRDGPLESREAARLTQGLADGLQHAHEHGVLHRDVKPGNVLLRGDSPLLTDFGLAKDVQHDRGALTQTGQVMGTPAFMPPEQARADAAELGPATDVYSLGATLYAMLTGQPPFRGSSLMEILHRVLKEDPTPPSELNPVDPALEAICLQCLCKSPTERYASAAALSADLNAYLNSKQTDDDVPGRRARRTGALGAGLLGLLLAGGAVAWSPWSIPDDGSPEQPVDWTPPTLTLDTLSGPIFKTTAASIEVGGRAADANLASVTLNGVALELDGGTFRREVSLGLTGQKTTLSVVARDQAGGVTEVERVVYRVPSWWAELKAPPPLPLPEGLSFGEATNEFLNLRDRSVLLWIPSGSYIMGSDEHEENQRPKHRVSFDPGYFFGKYETTWGQYRRFCAETKRASAPESPFDVADDHPVHSVTWEDAIAYCKWAGLRLPSEAEWEFAATGIEGRLYPWGDKHTPVQANFRGPADGHMYTAPVGSFPEGVSSFGSFNLGGNVLEWVQDVYLSHYRGAPRDGSARASSEASHRVYRGGSWLVGQTTRRRCTFRQKGVPTTAFQNLGFRPALSAREQTR
jgi:serine/threonine protein kinase/formylglycine-generating enzyme required for sulfatase activity